MAYKHTVLRHDPFRRTVMEVLPLPDGDDFFEALNDVAGGRKDLFPMRGRSDYKQGWHDLMAETFVVRVS